MIALLLDSSNANLSVGLAKDHSIIDFVHYDAWQRQSELMVSEIDNLLKKNGLTRLDIGEVIASKGPGSYTGVRIALTIGKVIACSLDIPLYLVSSLEAMRLPNGLSVCVSNARSKRSYIAIFDGDDTIVADTIWTNEETLRYFDEHPEAHLCGETSHLGRDSENANPLNWLKECDGEAYRVQDPRGAKPVYLKDNG